MSIVIVIAVLLVLGLGLLIFALQRRTSKVVPRVVDREGVDRDRVVAVDDEGRPVMASHEPEQPARDVAGFETILDEELEDLRGEKDG